MAEWLLKSEAESYSWDDLVRERETEWTGVRNHAAAAHLRAMRPGDRALFYHSGAEKAVVGTATITRAAQKDGEDGNWVSVALNPSRRSPVPSRSRRSRPRRRLPGWRCCASRGCRYRR